MISRERNSSTSLPRLDPKAGPWSLDWSLVDRGGKFPWPLANEPAYADLAVFLARHNELSLDVVMEMRRTNNKSAHHAVPPESLSADAQTRIDEHYKDKKVDEGPHADAELLSMSYCLAAGDPRRVICLFDGVERCLLPLWWDPNHEVLGADEKVRSVARCTEDCLHP